MSKLSELKSKKVAFSLAGGNLKGNAAHTGFMIAMYELGIDPYAIIGTSAGANIGGFIALNGLNEKSVNDLREYILALKVSEYIDKVSTFSLIMGVIRQGRGLSGFIKGDKFESFLNKIYKCASFGDCKIPFYAHVCNMDKAREEIIGVGHHTTSMARACRASSTIPLLFQPIEMLDEDGEMCYFVDGGILGLHAPEELAKRHSELDCIIVNDFHQHDEVKRPFMHKKLLPIKMIYRMYDANNIINEHNQT